MPVLAGGGCQGQGVAHLMPAADAAGLREGAPPGAADGGVGGVEGSRRSD